MRYPIALLILTGALAFSGAALARDISLPKTTPDALKSACDAAGGKFSQGSMGYGCGTDCKGGPGTDCIVHCDEGKKCTAQVIGSRRPHSVAQALTKPQRRRR
jgi:L-aminopeptidase/D-esterase-like protein